MDKATITMDRHLIQEATPNYQATVQHFHQPLTAWRIQASHFSPRLPLCLKVKAALPTPTGATQHWQQHHNHGPLPLLLSPLDTVADIIPVRVEADDTEV